MNIKSIIIFILLFNLVSILESFSELLIALMSLTTAKLSKKVEKLVNPESKEQPIGFVIPNNVINDEEDDSE